MGLAAVLALGLAAACSSSAESSPVEPSQPSTVAAAASDVGPGSVGHVWVVVLENKSYDSTFGPDSVAPYLGTELPREGLLLRQYFGIAHHSLPNYLAQISGQAPNPSTQDDCGEFTDFVRTGTAPPGQAVGDGCVYPGDVPTVAGQLDDAGLDWRGYFGDMGAPCRHPEVGARDDTHHATEDSTYATRHDPFVYFHAVIDRPDYCAQHVVDLSALPGDLSSVATTPAFSYVAPGLCDDGHDAPCLDGRPGGLATADTWLRTWVPRVTGSPAFRRDGLLVITFDEAETSGGEDADACCGQQPGPNVDSPGLGGPGGGRVGAVVLSPFVTPGSTSDTPYNHYSLLRSVEDSFGLGYLGYAARVHGFGPDVYTRPPS